MDPSKFDFPVKKLAKKKNPKHKALKYKLHICSVNNFPTAAGLASSAAGYSCLGLNFCFVVTFLYNEYAAGYSFWKEQKSLQNFVNFTNCLRLVYSLLLNILVSWSTG